jgi:hypothetical protein
MKRIKMRPNGSLGHRALEHRLQRASTQCGLGGQEQWGGCLERAATFSVSDLLDILVYCRILSI